MHPVLFKKLCIFNLSMHKGLPIVLNRTERAPTGKYSTSLKLNNEKTTINAILHVALQENISSKTRKKRICSYVFMLPDSMYKLLPYIQIVKLDLKEQKWWVSAKKRFININLFLVKFVLKARTRKHINTSLKEAIALITSLVNVLPTPDVPINTVGLIAY